MSATILRLNPRLAGAFAALFVGCTGGTGSLDVSPMTLDKAPSDYESPQGSSSTSNESSRGSSPSSPSSDSSSSSDGRGTVTPPTNKSPSQPPSSSFTGFNCSGAVSCTSQGSATEAYTLAAVGTSCLMTGEGLSLTLAADGKVLLGASTVGTWKATSGSAGFTVDVKNEASGKSATAVCTPVE
jgi:hypothetical protein